MTRGDTSKVFFPWWMKVLKVIGTTQTPYTIKTLVSHIGSYQFIYNMLLELERRGFIVLEKKNNETYIYMTSRGRILWKILMEMEMTMGEQM